MKYSKQLWYDKKKEDCFKQMVKISLKYKLFLLKENKFVYEKKWPPTTQKIKLLLPKYIITYLYFRLMLCVSFPELLPDFVYEGIVLELKSRLNIVLLFKNLPFKKQNNTLNNIHFYKFQYQFVFNENRCIEFGIFFAVVFL